MVLACGEQAIKGIVASILYSFGLLGLEEANCHIMWMLSLGEAHVARKCRLPANNHVSESFWK